VALKLNISEEKERFLLDTGADVSVINSRNVIGTAKFEPRRKTRLKGINGAVIVTHGTVEANIF
jgi:hypothetical protein